jgi:LDH2 family malate/lactate/ureidoglycolate dehydrogenase
MSTDKSSRISPEALRDLCRGVLEALGTPADLADVVADSLVQANLVGHDSHGVMRLNQYANQVRSGQVQPSGRASQGITRAGIATVDGAWGWGQPAARLAASTAGTLSQQQGVAAVTIAHCNHIGRLGEYVESIAQTGLIGVAMCNADPSVAPFGGRARLLGTNPMAWGIPRRDAQNPMVIDFATAGIAEGKLRVARALGETVPLGFIVDSFGRPSGEPAAFYDGGALLPFGGHKGFGLSLVVEILAGGLSGMAPSATPEYGGGNGSIVLAIDISAFVPFARFIDQVESLCTSIKASPRAEGVEEIWLPGEPEVATRRQRETQGISVPEQTWNEIQALAAELGVRVS